MKVQPSTSISRPSRRGPRLNFPDSSSASAFGRRTESPEGNGADVACRIKRSLQYPPRYVPPFSKHVHALLRRRQSPGCEGDGEVYTALVVDKQARNADLQKRLAEVSKKIEGLDERDIL